MLADSSCFIVYEKNDFSYNFISAVCQALFSIVIMALFKKIKSIQTENDFKDIKIMIQIES